MQTKFHRFTYILLVLFISSVTTSNAEEKNSKSGFIDFNFYPYLSDVDSDSSATINIAASLPNRFSYFSLINFGNQDSQDELEDIETFYTEHNLRWKLSENSPLDATLQVNLRSGEDNDRHRLGVRWRLNDTSFLRDAFEAINLSYALNLHFFQYDDEDAYVWQIEHSYRLTLPKLSDRIYLAGFIDHTFNEDLPSGFPSNPVVAETQIGYRIVENFYAISEYRINQYRRSDVNNLALGVEYKIKW